MNVLYLERTGTSLHIWVGPVGVHIFRHRSYYRPGFVELDWEWGWPDA